ncbi:MAG: hypothetical protein AB7E47_15510 [Desulfovibrionaceae bacterium]
MSGRARHAVCDGASRAAAGFTLVEIAFVVVIVGMILAAVMPRVIKSIQKDFLKTEKTQLRAARDEIVGYVVGNDCKLPTAISGHTVGSWSETFGYDYPPALSGVDLTTVTSTGVDVSIGGRTVSDVAFLVYSPGRNKVVDLSSSTSNGTTTYTVQGYDEQSASSTGNFDDIVDYVTLSYLKNLCSGDTSSGASTHITFSDSTMSDDFASPVQYNSQGQAVDSVSVNNDGTITLGGGLYNSYGCVWYTGSNSLCTTGNCTFGTGFRAFFQFEFNSTGTDKGDGFTFAAISSESNKANACGGRSDGISSGELLGYAGPGTTGKGIQAPKIAIEFDTWYNGWGLVCTPSGNRNDPSAFYTDTMAFVYWGDDEEDHCSPSSNTWDDNRHGDGLSYTPLAPYNWRLDSNSSDAVFYGTLAGQTFAPADSGGRYIVRMEVSRNETATTSTGRYRYILKAWVKRDQTAFSNFYDTERDYTAEAPTIMDTIELTESYHDLFDNILIGWTEGTGGAQQQLTLLKFDLAFRE